ncbi:MAG: amidohydrolase family protein [Blastocatellia bacterium]|nr:amidohydrolase family protein [Blastocatellia bacterium]
MGRATSFGEVEVFDGHVHLFSRRFFETLIGQSAALSAEPEGMARVEALTGWEMPPASAEGFAERWRGELDKHGVSGALMIGSLPNDEESVAAAVRAFPARLAGALMFDPTKPEAEARARRAFDELGVRVLCLFPAMHHFSVAESDGVRAVASLAAERPGAAVFVHCGTLSVGVRKKLGLPSPFDMRRSNPLEIYRVAAEFPRANFIVPYFGAGMFREAMMLADLCPNVYVDTSSSNKWMSYEAAPVDLPTIFRRAIDVMGHERLLFGTDSSFFPRGWHSAIFEAQTAALAAIGATDEQARAIFGGNLRRLLGIRGPQTPSST